MDKKNNKLVLDQIEADLLLEHKKYFVDNSIIKLEKNNKNITRIIKSIDNKEDFILDISKGRINLSRVKYQSRHKLSNTILLRIDTSSGARHINPDGQFIECPHIHIYKEGYGSKWAYPLDPNIFTNPNDTILLLKEFLMYFNVLETPQILGELNFLEK